jgi:hypothetical protein
MQPIWITPIINTGGGTYPTSPTFPGYTITCNTGGAL